MHVVQREVALRISRDQEFVVGRKLKAQHPVLVLRKCGQGRFGVDVPESADIGGMINKYIVITK